MLRKKLSFFKNKYVLVLLAALIWILFFDQNNLIRQYRLSMDIKKLEQEREYYLEQIARDSTEMERLLSEPSEMERYAREKYLMKKEDEDIFIIEKKND
jgi:cell division protein FtsB